MYFSKDMLFVSNKNYPIAWQYFEKAEKYLEQEKYEEAIKTFEESKKLSANIYSCPKRNMKMLSAYSLLALEKTKHKKYQEFRFT